MSTSEKQLQANRENGQFGGVKTDVGKAVSKLNAITHGILSNYQTKFDSVDFNELFNEFADEFGASTPSRRVLIEQLTITYIRLLRCMRFESDKLKEALNPPTYSTQIHGADIMYREERVLKEKNDQAPMTEQTLSQLSNLYFSYEPQLFTRFKKLIEMLNGPA